MRLKITIWLASAFRDYFVLLFAMLIHISKHKITLVENWLDFFALIIKAAKQIFYEIQRDSNALPLM